MMSGQVDLREAGSSTAVLSVLFSLGKCMSFFPLKKKKKMQEVSLIWLEGMGSGEQQILMLSSRKNEQKTSGRAV